MENYAKKYTLLNFAISTPLLTVKSEGGTINTRAQIIIRLINKEVYIGRYYQEGDFTHIDPFRQSVRRVNTIIRMPRLRITLNR